MPSTSNSQMWQQGWSSIIIPQWIEMSISAHAQHPRCWPVATEWRLSTPSTLTSTIPSAHVSPAVTSQSSCRGSGTCLETTSATPWWPAELSQLQNQGHARRGPDFIITKTFPPLSECNWLQESFHSIFSLNTFLSFFLWLSCHLI